MHNSAFRLVDAFAVENVVLLGYEAGSLGQNTRLSNEGFSGISNFPLPRNLLIRMFSHGASYRLPEERNFQLNSCVSLKLEKSVSPLPRHYSNQYESASPVKFKVFSCYFVNNAVSEREANYAVLQQPKSQPSPVFTRIKELLVRLNHGN